MLNLGTISHSDWEHLKKVCKDTPPNCPYLVLVISTGKKFGISKTQKNLTYQVNLMHLNPPANKSRDVIKADPEEWTEAEEIATGLLKTCKSYAPATKK